MTSFINRTFLVTKIINGRHSADKAIRLEIVAKWRDAGHVSPDLHLPAVRNVEGREALGGGNPICRVVSDGIFVCRSLAADCDVQCQPIGGLRLIAWRSRHLV